jgi:transposase-like protein
MICPRCQGASSIKAGFYKSDILIKQRYRCGKCQKTFSNIGRNQCKAPEEISKNWKQRIFRTPPELNSFIECDRESFQKIVENLLKQRYGL